MCIIGRSLSCFLICCNTYWYLYAEVAHKAVREWCERQGEAFSISSKSLLKALAEEGTLHSLPQTSSVQSVDSGAA